MTWDQIPLLTPLILAPAIGALVVAMLPKNAPNLAKGTALGWSIGVFLLSIGLAATFDPYAPGLQFEHKMAWITSLNINYHVGIDGINILLVMLTTFLIPLAIFASWHSVQLRAKEFMIHLLIVQTGIIGALTAIDLVIFYFFWETMLIPLYFLVGIFGTGRRQFVTLKLVIFTMAGSLLMLVSLMYAGWQHQVFFGQFSTSLPDLINLSSKLGTTTQLWLFGGFFVAFAIKAPLFPLHPWQPDAYAEAPTAGSVVLAALMGKVGVYGLLRFAIPLFPAALAATAPYIAALAVIGVLYGALVATVQKDMKRLIAYSSISHMGVIILGVVAMTSRSISGAVFLMVAHGIVIATLFFVVAILERRGKSRLIDDYSGLAKIMPAFAALTLVTALAYMGLPGLAGFPGEFFALLGAFTTANIPAAWAYAAIASTGAVWVTVYMLWWYQRVFLGPIRHEEQRSFARLSWREHSILLIPVAAMIVLGIFPNLLLTPMGPSVDRLVIAYGASQPAPQRVETQQVNQQQVNQQQVRPQVEKRKPTRQMREAPKRVGIPKGDGTYRWVPMDSLYNGGSKTSKKQESITVEKPVVGIPRPDGSIKPVDPASLTTDKPKSVIKTGDIKRSPNTQRRLPGNLNNPFLKQAPKKPVESEK